MARVRHRSDVAVPPREDPITLSFTADSGKELAALAGEALARRRGNALRPGWRPVHTSGVFVSGSFTAIGGAGPLAPTYLTPGLTSQLAVTARFSQLRPTPPGERSASRSPWPGGAPAPARRCDDGSRCDVHGPIPGVDTRAFIAVSGRCAATFHALDPDGVADRWSGRSAHP